MGIGVTKRNIEVRVALVLVTLTHLLWGDIKGHRSEVHDPHIVNAGENEEEPCRKRKRVKFTLHSKNTRTIAGTGARCSWGFSGATNCLGSLCKHTTIIFSPFHIVGAEL